MRVTADQPDSLPGNNSNQSFVLYYSCDVLCSLEALFCEVQNVRSPIASGRAEGPSVLRWPAALQEEAIDLLVYHFVRDRVLAGTEDGQRYVDLYYAHDVEIQTLLDADDALKAEATATLKLWEPHLWALVLGDGDEATITTAQVAAVDAFLANLSAAAGPALQAAIAAERDRLPPPDTFVGLTMAEARGLTVGYGRYLPLALRE